MIEIVALSDAMREAVGLAERVATTDANVLVTGESGAGKDALAAFIHSRSPRASQPLVKIDCATLPADLLEAELFGYERGAFTGATESKPGRLEAPCGAATARTSASQSGASGASADACNNVIISNGQKPVAGRYPSAANAATIVQPAKTSFAVRRADQRTSPLLDRRQAGSRFRPVAS